MEPLFEVPEVVVQCSEVLVVLISVGFGDVDAVSLHSSRVFGGWIQPEDGVNEFVFPLPPVSNPVPEVVEVAFSEVGVGCCISLGIPEL